MRHWSKLIVVVTIYLARNHDLKYEFTNSCPINKIRNKINRLLVKITKSCFDASGTLWLDLLTGNAKG